MKVYGNPLSNNYKRIAVCAAELGVPIEHVLLDPKKGENRTPEYLAKNPMGKIPTFEDDDGWTLWESPAVLLYLCEQHTDRQLVPTDVRERADAWRWMFWNASHLEPSANRLYFQRVLRPLRGLPIEPPVLEAAGKELARFLPVLNGRLEGREWLMGERFTVVDIVIGTAVELLGLPQVSFDVSPYPYVQSWYARLAARPSWKAAEVPV
jgi:glutathione S-transferase